MVLGGGAPLGAKDDYHVCSKICFYAYMFTCMHVCKNTCLCVHDKYMHHVLHDSLDYDKKIESLVEGRATLFLSLDSFCGEKQLCKK